MALLAEELVEEWLNRNGYFTIRGIKLGVHEVDLLAMKPTASGLECRHIEVQASVRPVSYITALPREVQKTTGRAPMSAKLRHHEELVQGVREWIDKKFDLPRKAGLRRMLCDLDWSRELVVHKVKYESELGLSQEAGVSVHRLDDIIVELLAGGQPIEGAAGGGPSVDLARDGRAGYGCRITSSSRRAPHPPSQTS